MAIKLDEIDIQLLAELQADADKTNVELARVTGLSPAATLHRVRALKESGVIRIVRAHVDPALVGFPLQVFVMATLPRHDPRSGARFEAYVRSLPQVIGATASRAKPTTSCRWWPGTSPSWPRCWRACPAAAASAWSRTCGWPR